MPRQASLSIDLLRTFLLLIKEEGDAASTARILGINQPSMSKRLGYLQHAGAILARPWLVREGKTWKLTEEGARGKPWSAQVEALAPKVKPRGLVGLPLLLPEPGAGTRKEFDEALREKNVLAELDIVIEMGGWEALLDYVREGAGVGVLSDAVL